jgi:hypothetical protein
MHQTFSLFLSPRTGRVAVRPVNRRGQFCQTFFTFKDATLAQQFLDNSKAVKIRGGDSINGTYTMEIVPQAQEQKVSN